MKILVSLLALVFAVPALAVPAVCTASGTHFCVTHDGVAFGIDKGSGNVRQQALSLTVGTSYTFEMASGDFSSHPFILTDSANGGGVAALTDGVTGTNPATAVGETITYAPTAAGNHFYQCNVHTGMGAPITVANPASDAGTVADAGTLPVDAGTPIDAGVPVADAGTSPMPPAPSTGCSSTGFEGFALALCALGIFGFSRRKV